MTAEEKAKAYDEALDRAIELYEKDSVFDSEKTLIRCIFPELAESEDEKIRKALIKGVECCKASGWTNFGNNVDIDVVLAWLKEQGKQKPAWSEEDKDFMYDTLSNLTELKDRYGEGYGNVGKCINWLKSIKDRVQPKPKEWSEEDERICQCLIKDQEESLDEVRNDKYGHSEIISDLKEMYRERINWLKSLKERIKGKED